MIFGSGRQGERRSVTPDFQTFITAFQCSEGRQAPESSLTKHVFLQLFWLEAHN